MKETVLEQAKKAAKVGKDIFRPQILNSDGRLPVEKVEDAVVKIYDSLAVVVLRLIDG